VNQLIHRQTTTTNITRKEEWFLCPHEELREGRQLRFPFTTQGLEYRQKSKHIFLSDFIEGRRLSRLIKQVPASVYI
jgi:hypothetical protein